MDGAEEGYVRRLEKQISACEARLAAAERLCDCWEAYEDVLTGADWDEEETVGHFARCSLAWNEWNKTKDGA